MTLRIKSAHQQQTFGLNFFSVDESIKRICFIDYDIDNIDVKHKPIDNVQHGDSKSCKICHLDWLSAGAFAQHLQTQMHKRKQIINLLLNCRPDYIFKEAPQNTNCVIDELLLQNSHRIIGLDQFLVFRCDLQSRLGNKIAFWLCKCCNSCGRSQISSVFHLLSTSHRSTFIKCNHPDSWKQLHPKLDFINDAQNSTDVLERFCCEQCDTNADTKPKVFTIDVKDPKVEDLLHSLGLDCWIDDDYSNPGGISLSNRTTYILSTDFGQPRLQCRVCYCSVVSDVPSMGEVEQNIHNHELGILHTNCLNMQGESKFIGECKREDITFRKAFAAIPILGVSHLKKCKSLDFVCDLCKLSFASKHASNHLISETHLSNYVLWYYPELIETYNACAGDLQRELIALVCKKIAEKPCFLDPATAKVNRQNTPEVIDLSDCEDGEIFTDVEMTSTKPTPDGKDKRKDFKENEVLRGRNKRTYNNSYDFNSTGYLAAAFNRDYYDWDQPEPNWVGINRNPDTAQLSTLDEYMHKGGARKRVWSWSSTVPPPPTRVPYKYALPISGPNVAQTSDFPLVLPNPNAPVDIANSSPIIGSNKRVCFESDNVLKQNISVVKPVSGPAIPSALPCGVPNLYSTEGAIVFPNWTQVAPTCNNNIRLDKVESTIVHLNMASLASPQKELPRQSIPLGEHPKTKFKINKKVKQTDEKIEKKEGKKLSLLEELSRREDEVQKSRDQAYKVKQLDEDPGLYKTIQKHMHQLISNDGQTNHLKPKLDTSYRSLGAEKPGKQHLKPMLIQHSTTLMRVSTDATPMRMSTDATQMRMSADAAQISTDATQTSIAATQMDTDAAQMSTDATQTSIAATQMRISTDAAQMSTDGTQTCIAATQMSMSTNTKSIQMSMSTDATQMSTDHSC